MGSTSVNWYYEQMTKAIGLACAAKQTSVMYGVSDELLADNASRLSYLIRMLVAGRYNVVRTTRCQTPISANEACACITKNVGGKCTGQAVVVISWQ
jgi:hypothetical protein